MPWYTGTTLLTALEAADPTSPTAERAFRMPVQHVTRPDHTFRGYAGTVATGTHPPRRRGGECDLRHRGRGGAHRHHGRRA